jgi:hypothetical protein
VVDISHNQAVHPATSLGRTRIACGFYRSMRRSIASGLSRREPRVAILPQSRSFGTVAL